MSFLPRTRIINSCTALMGGLLLSSAGAWAVTPIAECPKKYEPATVDVQARVSTNLKACPILEQKDFRKLVNQYAFGTTFAHPAVPNTCVSGVVTGGSVTTRSGAIAVTGSTESAQRFFAEAYAINPALGGVYLGGISQPDAKPFLSGAAMTVVNLKGVDSKFKLQLLMDDRFSLDLSSYPVIDTEDFNIVGSNGPDTVGRLTGTAVIYDDPTAPLDNVGFSVTGTVCIKQ